MESSSPAGAREASLLPEATAGCSLKEVRSVAVEPPGARVSFDAAAKSPPGRAEGRLEAEAGVPHLLLENVSKTYRSRRGLVQALETASFSMETDEFVSILGPSGCGKSTLLMMIAGLVPLSSGRIEINGKQVVGVNPDLGIVFQRDALLDWRTVLRNVMLPVEIRRLNRKLYRERARELLDLTGLEGFEDRYPYELSGGMRQRVAICRALVHSPSLLLMDEPFGALDALTRERMMADLIRIHEKSGTTVLFITHSIPESVFLSDRVIVMSRRPGRILEALDVPLPRPRTIAMMEDPAFTTSVGHLRRLFADEGVLVS
jgi:NitT/TauT family transport system ATP-binding protein